MDFMIAYYAYDTIGSLKAVLWFGYVFLLVGMAFYGFIVIPSYPHDDMKDEEIQTYEAMRKMLIVFVVGFILILTTVNILPSQVYLAYNVIEKGENELKKDISPMKRKFIQNILNDVMKGHFNEEGK